MPKITFSGLPIDTWATMGGAAQNLLFIALIFFSLRVFLARRRAVLMALALKKSEDRWKNDPRFKIPWIAPVDPAIFLLWGKVDDLPDALREAILRWRTLTNRAFLVGLALFALVIWRH